MIHHLHHQNYVCVVSFLSNCETLVKEGIFLSKIKVLLSIDIKINNLDNQQYFFIYLLSEIIFQALYCDYKLRL